MLEYNGKLKPLARVLRKNMTDAEKLLWLKLKGRQLKKAQFCRQKTIGNYIVDFYCYKSKLIIEIDGSQHYETKNAEKDKIRDKYLGSLGFSVLGFTNIEILKNIDAVLDKIYMEISH